MSVMSVYDCLLFRCSNVESFRPQLVNCFHVTRFQVTLDSLEFLAILEILEQQEVLVREVFRDSSARSVQWAVQDLWVDLVQMGQLVSLEIEVQLE